VTPTLPRCARYAARSSGFTDVPVIQGKLAVVTMVKCLPGSRSEVAASCWGAVPRHHIFKGIPARVVCRSDARGGLLQTCSRFSKKPSSFSGSSQIRGFQRWRILFTPGTPSRTRGCLFVKAFQTNLRVVTSYVHPLTCGLKGAAYSSA
jgi:hypothetical protein